VLSVDTNAGTPTTTTSILGQESLARHARVMAVDDA
jgi:hypothetical protein